MSAPSDTIALEAGGARLQGPADAPPALRAQWCRQVDAELDRLAAELTCRDYALDELQARLYSLEGEASDLRLDRELKG